MVTQQKRPERLTQQIERGDIVLSFSRRRCEETKARPNMA